MEVLRCTEIPSGIKGGAWRTDLPDFRRRRFDSGRTSGGRIRGKGRWYTDGDSANRSNCPGILPNKRRGYRSS